MTTDQIERIASKCGVAIDRLRVYEPVGSARDLMTSRAYIVGCDGPTRTGKSRAALEKVNACCEKYPGCRVLLVRQTLASLRKTGMQTFEDDVLGRDNPICSSASRDTRTSDYKYPNGSTVSFVGLDDVSKVLSGEYDLIFVQQMEEVAERDIMFLMTRLSGGAMPYRQIIFDCNPGLPDHWIKIWQNEGKLTMFPSRHIENPRLYDRDAEEWTELGREYIEGLELMPEGFIKDRLMRGMWVSAEGARFPYLRRGEHTFDKREKWPKGLPEGYDVIVGIDYGIRAPYCALWIAVDFDGDMWVFREDYEPGFGAWEQAQRVVELTARNERVRYVYADPACWSEMIDASGRTGVSTADYYARAFEKDDRFGPLLKGFNKSRRSGMDTLDLLFQRGNGCRDLWVEEHCVNLWKELTNAVWDSRNPVKEDLDPSCADHAITALYYGVHTYINPPDSGEEEPITAERTAKLWARQRYEQSLKQSGTARRTLRV